MANATLRNPRFKVMATVRDQSAVDVTDFILKVSTTRSLGQFKGSFTLELRNRLDFVKLKFKAGETFRQVKDIESFFRPMTYIEIFISAKDPNNFTPVMRGFIDSVGGFQNAGDNSAQDRALVSGSDIGKAFVNQKVFFRPELSRIIAVGGQQVPVAEGAAANAFAIKTGDFTAAVFSLPLFNREFTPNQFMHEMLSIFIHPYINKVLEGYSIERIGEHLAGTFLISNNVEIVPVKMYLISLTTHQGSILSVLDYGKNSPWCEMFLQEGADRTIFVFRATPWKTPVGGGRDKLIPLMKTRDSSKGEVEAKEDPSVLDIAQEVEVTDTKGFELVGELYDNAYYEESRDVLKKIEKVTLLDIIDRQIYRDDSEVFTYFVTYPYEFMNWKIANLNGLYQHPEADSNPFLLRGHTDFYGFRPLEVKSTFTPFILDVRDPSPDTKNKGGEKQLTERRSILDAYLTTFNKSLVEAFKYNPDYEKGTIRIVGNEKIYIGQYIDVEVIDGRNGTFYVESVTHNFRAFNQFTTELRVTRGTAAINNGNSIVDQFLNDIQTKAVKRDKDLIFKSPNQNAKSPLGNGTRDANKKYPGK